MKSSSWSASSTNRIRSTWIYYPLLNLTSTLQSSFNVSAYKQWCQQLYSRFQFAAFFASWQTTYYSIQKHCINSVPKSSIINLQIQIQRVKKKKFRPASGYTVFTLLFLPKLAAPGTFSAPSFSYTFSRCSELWSVELSRYWCWIAWPSPASTPMGFSLCSQGLLAPGFLPDRGKSFTKRVVPNFSIVFLTRVWFTFTRFAISLHVACPDQFHSSLKQCTVPKLIDCLSNHTRMLTPGDPRFYFWTLLLLFFWVSYHLYSILFNLNKIALNS